MVDQAALLDALTAFGKVFATGTDDLGSVLDLVGHHTVRVLQVDGAGVTLTDESGQTQHLTATDPAALLCERVQDEQREGPCFHAMEQAQVLPIDDLNAIIAWDAYRTTALDQGLVAVLSVPLRTSRQSLGAIDVYRRSPGPWDMDQQQAAQALADLASGYAAKQFALTRSEALAVQLQHALDSRVIIEQAKGVLAERHGIGTDAAFERIRDHARRERVKLHDIAAAVVAGRLDL